MPAETVSTPKTVTADGLTMAAFLLDMGTFVTSRREEVHALGLEDYKLAAYCRNLLKKYPDDALQKELDSIILKGAEADMKGMEQCRLQMLELAEKLIAKVNKK